MIADSDSDLGGPGPEDSEASGWFTIEVTAGRSESEFGKVINFKFKLASFAGPGRRRGSRAVRSKSRCPGRR